MKASLFSLRARLILLEMKELNLSSFIFKVLTKPICLEIKYFL